MKNSRTFLKSTSFGRICLISVSNFVRHTSSSNALKLNCDVAQSKTHTPNRCPFSSPLAMTLPLLLFLSDPSSTPGSSNTQTQCPACSSLRNSGSTRVPFVYTLLSSLLKQLKPERKEQMGQNFPHRLTIFSLAEAPPLDFSFSAAWRISAPKAVSACSTRPTL